MNLPKLTVVTTSFNQADYLEKTIHSVLDQGYPDLEYIIVDGGSSDNSPEIIRRYEKHLAWWVSEKDNGMYDGLQKGFARSTGDIMSWINSDDLFHPGSFFVAADVFTQFPAVEWIQGLPSAIDETGRTVAIKEFRKWSKINYFLRDKEHIQQESTFWRRSLWEKAGGTLDTSLRYAGDYDLWLRFFDHAELYCLKTILGAFRFRAANQFTLERIGEYNMEAERQLLSRMARLSPAEQEAIALVNRYRKVYSKIPWLRSRKAAAMRDAFGYPPAIYYDRSRQAFQFDK